ncbi:MAG: M48 family metallopeptidase [Paracoccaceae bacterium]
MVGHATSAGRAPVSFAAVARRIEPLAEQICRQRTPRSNCDFRIFIDSRTGQPPNAYQTVDDQGRPEIGFTTALIAQAHNNDELAFVLGHETAHHILGHIAKTRDTALAGALLGGVLATLAGGSASTVDLAQNIGGTVGARAYSKDFELEADRLGTEIAYRAGYDPLDGALFFTRIPDPGDQFLGTHPPNGARIATVRQAMDDLR